ncbi:MAG TPA: hypothetical protein VK184_05095 [Nostocaceae cyanobacterium]|nr:hypothetical protein [Nostocaceae cyanobacterium]
MMVIIPFLSTTGQAGWTPLTNTIFPERGDKWATQKQKAGRK